MNFLQMIQESAFDHHSTLQMQRLPESQQSDYEIFRSVCKDAQLCDGCTVERNFKHSIGAKDSYFVC